MHLHKKRIRKKKTFYDKDTQDDPILDLVVNFKSNVINVTLDAMVNEIFVRIKTWKR